MSCTLVTQRGHLSRYTIRWPSLIWADSIRVSVANEIFKNPSAAPPFSGIFISGVAWSSWIVELISHKILLNCLNVRRNVTATSYSAWSQLFIKHCWKCFFFKYGQHMLFEVGLNLMDQFITRSQSPLRTVNKFWFKRVLAISLRKRN